MIKTNTLNSSVNKWSLAILFLAVAFFPTRPLFAQAKNTAVPSATDEATVRHFEFTYSGSVENVPDGKTARVWLPVANGINQQIISIDIKLPAEHQVNQDDVYGNNILYFDVVGKSEGGKAASIPFSITYEVKRNEVNGLKKTEAPSLAKEQKDLFLRANSKVPIDGKPLTLLEGVELDDQGVGKAKSLYECVEQYMTYDKSKPGYGNGDVMWACDSKTGNCTDFHSVFISLARSQNIPAHFEIGFPLPPERGEGKIGGYHCWAKFHIDGKGWIPVDISEADKHPEMKDYYFGNLTENRIGFSKGRDIDLKPKQESGSLNYFVYPHVEVDGEMWDRENIKLDFRYKDMVSGDASDSK